MVKLDILSDPICPWCYIGKRQLDRALADRPDHPFTIEWHPFQLNPDMQAEGMDREIYLNSKFGSKAGAGQVYGRIRDYSQEIALELNLDAIKRTPNTLNAHRMIHWAGIERKQTQMVDALFHAYFVEGRDIGDPDTLADLGDGVGLDAALVHRLLATEEDVQMIRDRDAQAREMGVTSVPTFIVAGKHAVPGAQPPEMWLGVIDEIASQLAEAE